MHTPYSGYVQIRRGILEHLRLGLISPTDKGFYETFIEMADPRTGILNSNAAELAFLCCSNRKTVQKFLCRLERKGYIKRFSTPRSHGKYAILINRYRCTLSPHKNMELNADKTTDWRFPIYEQVSRPGARESATPLHKERARGELRIENKTKVKSRPPTPRAPTTPARRSETEQRRIVDARDNRQRKETEVRIATSVGKGPELPPDVAVCCIECHAANPTDWNTSWLMGENQFNRCLAGKPPRGSQSECPRHPKAVSVGTRFHRAAGVG
jgi:ribosomal protein S8